MKTLIKLVLPAIAVLVLVTAAVSPPGKPIAPYEREQTKDDIRVVLLKVERTVAFTTEGIRDPQPGKVYPVPMFCVTYLIEALSDEARKSVIHNCDVEATINGKRFDDYSLLPENVVRGGHSGSTAISSLEHPRFGNDPTIVLPAIKEENLPNVEESRIRVPNLPNGNAQLKITVPVKGRKAIFIFDNVPLG